MENFIAILSKPDNIPIVGMIIAFIFFLRLWLRQATRHDKLIRQGKKEEIIDEMIR